MIWALKAFILEEMNLFGRHDLTMNIDRSIRRVPVRCTGKDNLIFFILKSDSLMIISYYKFVIGIYSLYGWGFLYRGLYL
jgi:hypothetical protein